MSNEERLAALEARLTERDRAALVADVAEAKGLTAAQAKRLRGTTRQELEADADELLSLLPPGVVARKPRERLTGPVETGSAGRGGYIDPAKAAEGVPRVW